MHPLTGGRVMNSTANAGGPPHLVVRNISKTYRDGALFGGRRTLAVDDVSLVLRQVDGRVLSIVGESGSGKTSLARMILRLMSPDSGEISVAGSVIASGRGGTINNYALRRLVQPIFQNPFGTFSLQLPPEEYLTRTAINLETAGAGSSVQSVVEEALDAVGLSYARIRGKGLRAFSGGELQRISIARALIAKPRL